MPLETATYILQLVPTNPPGTDQVLQGDDHIRLVKTCLKNSFVGYTGPGLPTSTGTVNAQVVTFASAPTALQAGMRALFTPGFTNTGPCTLNVNGLGPLPLNVNGVALAGGELVAGSGTVEAVLNSALTVWNIISNVPALPGTLTGHGDQAIQITSAAGQSSRYRSLVTGARDWIFGTESSGVFAIGDQTAGLDRLSIDVGGLVTIPQSLTVQGNTFTNT